jgi:hypothetical protein
MTDIYVEVGKKQAIAWSPEWPGWCRMAWHVVDHLWELEERQR